MPIWGRRHQLDDQNRNNRDHLVGRPTKYDPDLQTISTTHWETMTQAKNI